MQIVEALWQKFMDQTMAQGAPEQELAERKVTFFSGSYMIIGELLRTIKRDPKSASTFIRSVHVETTKFLIAFDEERGDITIQ